MRLSTKDAPMETNKPKTIWERLTNVGERSGLNPIEAFAAALDPLIMPEMRAGGAIREAGAQRAKYSREQNLKNKTIAELQRRASTGDKLAERYLMGIESGAIPVAEGLSSYYRDLSSQDVFDRQQAAILAQEQRQIGRETERRNKTADYLRSIEMPGAASLVDAGLFTGAQAVEFSKNQRDRNLAEEAAAALQAGDNAKAMALLTQLSPTAMGQQLAARTAKPKAEVIGGGKYTVTYDDAETPTIKVNEDVIAAEQQIAQQQKVAQGLPADARKAEEEDFQAIDTLSNLIEDTSGIVDLFGYDPKTNSFQGPLGIGPLDWLGGKLGSMGAGMGMDELAKARGEFNRFKTRFINNSLRLNKGVQTEGDAQRVANELETANTEATAYAAIQELLEINQRAYADRVASINRRRERFGLPSIETPAAPTSPNLQWSIVK